MGRRDERRVGLDARQQIGPQAVLVDRHRHDLQPRVREHPAVDEEARVLDDDPPRAATQQRPRQQRQPLRQPAHDQQPRRLGGDAARPPEVARQRHAQGCGAAGIGIAEGGVGQLAGGGPQRARPRCAREGGEIGHAGVEVLRHRPLRQRGRRRLDSSSPSPRRRSPRRDASSGSPRRSAARTPRRRPRARRRAAAPARASPGAACRPPGASPRIRSRSSRSSCVCSGTAPAPPLRSSVNSSSTSGPFRRPWFGPVEWSASGVRYRPVDQTTIRRTAWLIRTRSPSSAAA